MLMPGAAELLRLGVGQKDLAHLFAVAERMVVTRNVRAGENDVTALRSCTTPCCRPYTQLPI